jgi:hypothetical protein
MRKRDNINSTKLKELFKNVEVQVVQGEKVENPNATDTSVINDLLQKVSSVNKELIYNYDYIYYDLDGTSLTLNEENNNKYGTSRKGYESFRSDSSGLLSVGYSGVTSLREVYTTDSLDLVGYITETKRATKPYIKEASDIYDDALQEFIRLLEVKDLESLDFYIQEENPYDFMSKDRVNEQTRSVRFLLEIIEKYDDDENFKKFFNKIIH